MAAIRFKGFPRSVPLAGKAAAAAAGGASVRIETQRGRLGVAPEGVFFEALVEGFDTPGPAPGRIADPRFHELYYIWNFGDPGARFVAPVNLVAAHRDANVGYGPLTAHTFTRAGRYEVAVMVIEPASGKTATASLLIEVRDPDAAFPGRSTLYVHPGRDVAAAPPGAQAFASLDAAVEAARKLRAPSRILLARGAEHAVGGIDFGGLPGLYLAAGPGTGPRPRLVRPKGGPNYLMRFTKFDPDRARDAILSGLHLAGSWDAATETGRADLNGLVLGKDEPSHLLVHDCRIEGFSGCVSASRLTAGGVRLFSETTITGWRDYGIYDSAHRHFALMGCSLVQDPDARAGGDKDGRHNNHNPIRFANCGKVSIDATEFYSRTGWTVNVKPWRTPQPCLRWNQNSVAGAKGNLQRVSAEGGYAVLSFGTVRASVPAKPQNVLVDHCLIVGTHLTRYPVQAEFGALTLRNSILIVPRVPRYGTDSTFVPFCGLALENSGKIPETTESPIRAYSNTLVNLMADADSPKGAARMRRFVGKPESFAEVTDANNIVFEPNTGEPQTADGPLDTTPVFPPREKGYLAEDVPELQAGQATPPDTVRLPWPLAGSPALGSALAGPVAVDDFLGRQRPAYPSRGALEMQ